MRFTDEEITAAFITYLDHVNNGGSINISSIRALFLQKLGYGFQKTGAMMRILQDEDNQQDFLRMHPEYKHNL